MPVFDQRGQKKCGQYARHIKIVVSSIASQLPYEESFFVPYYIHFSLYTVFLQNHPEFLFCIV